MINGQLRHKLDSTTLGSNFLNLYNKLPRSKKGLLARVLSEEDWLHRRRYVRMGRRCISCGTRADRMPVAIRFKIYTIADD